MQLGTIYLVPRWLQPNQLEPNGYRYRYGSGPKYRLAPRVPMDVPAVPGGVPAVPGGVPAVPQGVPAVPWASPGRPRRPAVPAVLESIPVTFSSMLHKHGLTMKGKTNNLTRNIQVPRTLNPMVSLALSHAYSRWIHCSSLHVWVHFVLH